MRKILAYIPVLLISVALFLINDTSNSTGLDDGIVLAQGGTQTTPPPAGTAPKSSKKKPKKPPVMQTVPRPSRPAGACEATKGQTGKCICSTNAKGNTTCTGNCCE
jgi:hypothetical protein